MKRTDFYYDLPEELIAQEPLKDRSSSRLMILDKNTGEIEHKHFYDIVDELNEGDAPVSYTHLHPQIHQELQVSCFPELLEV